MFVPQNTFVSFPGNDHPPFPIAQLDHRIFEVLAWTIEDFEVSSYQVSVYFIMVIPGSSKKGSSMIRRIKVVKVNGAVLSITTAGNLKHLAIGSDQGYVSFFTY